MNKNREAKQFAKKKKGINVRNVFISSLLALTLISPSPALAQETPVASIEVGTYRQEVQSAYTRENGLPSNVVVDAAATDDGLVYAATEAGVVFLQDGKWREVPNLGLAQALAADGNALWAATSKGLFRVENGKSELSPAILPAGLNSLAAAGGTLLAGTGEGLYSLREDSFGPVTALNEMLGNTPAVLDVAAGADGAIAVAALSGLYEKTASGWQQLYPRNEKYSWAPHDVRAAAYTEDGSLWFACPYGVGRRSNGSWSLYTGNEGLPYNDFTAMTTVNNTVWFGTKIGAIRYDGSHWAYRQGQRWLPADPVNAIAVRQDGTAYIATDAGLSVIGFEPMTLAEKADFFEEEIDKYNRRTDLGYVIEAHLPAPGVKEGATTHDSDNDGLWTAMYGAGECFAYAATKDPEAKRRAEDAFEALRFLTVVTRNSTPPALPGFVARTVLPVSEGNPNEEHYTVEKDQRSRQGDKLWKVLWPRWPLSKNQQWYFKADTSSDELDGHYFFYALYYDLVAETEEERSRVREIVAGLTDHLVEHDFKLIDWDNEPTRWAIYDPEEINNNPWWHIERGLNSLSMLSYLRTAQHITGDAKYADAFHTLVEDHGYAQNAFYPKFQMGPGSGNHSDDEMAFMCYYNLLKYETDPVLKGGFAYSLANYWRLEDPENNPFFDFVAAASTQGVSFESAFVNVDLTLRGDEWLRDSVDTLKRYPLDQVNWRHTNHHRLDIVPLGDHVTLIGDNEPPHHGHKRNGDVLPVDERHFNHLNHNPWELDTGGNGTTLADGASFLLPYYMGRYHGYIQGK